MRLSNQFIPEVAEVLDNVHRISMHLMLQGSEPSYNVAMLTASLRALMVADKVISHALTAFEEYMLEAIADTNALKNSAQMEDEGGEELDEIFDQIYKLWSKINNKYATANGFTQYR